MYLVANQGSSSDVGKVKTAQVFPLEFWSFRVFGLSNKIVLEVLYPCCVVFFLYLSLDVNQLILMTL